MRQIWRLTDTADRLWLALGAATLLGASAAELLVPGLVASGLFAAVGLGGAGRGGRGAGPDLR
eukprot:155617-Pyramimonas_sp.AAC.1